jgi:hypothetical protein
LAAPLRLRGETAGKTGDLTAQRPTFRKIEPIRNKHDPSIVVL